MDDNDDAPSFDLDGPSTSAQAVAAMAAEDASRPDEVLAISSGYEKRKVWLVKVPKFLQERWAQVEEKGKHLATMRVYESEPDQKPRIELILPAEAEYDTTDLVDTYDLTIIPEPTEESGGKRSNAFLMTDTRRDVRQRLNPTLHSSIHHTASLRPKLSSVYSKSLRERQARADKPKRTVMRLDEEALGAAKVAQMASGFAGAGGIVSVKGKGRFGGFEAKKKVDKATRLPKNELLDLLFKLFDEAPYWRLKGLKQKTSQPEAYLKDTLSDIGTLVKRGPYVGCWTLLGPYREAKEKERARAQAAVKAAEDEKAGVKVEGGVEEDDDDDDDDEDEEMEEV